MGQDTSDRRRLADRSLVAAMAMVILAGCTGAAPSPAPTMRDVMAIPKFAPLAPGTYVIDPDSDPATSLRVVYDVGEGWVQWFGALKGVGEGHVMVNITTIVNVVRDACLDHAWADPPIGPTVDDLAVALADLAPFRVTAGPEDVTKYGYDGKYLELAALGLPNVGGEFTGCTDGNLLSWVAPIDVAEGEKGAFHGYNADPVEAFWILDVAGERLVIEANWSIDTPAEPLAELRAVLESIRIEP